MKVTLAFFAVVLLWSTTPLAIKWSGEGPGFAFGVTSRMLIGAFCVFVYLLARRQPIPLNRRAVATYLAAGLHVYAAMLVMYWAVQFIPSGWMAVIFGLTPMLTAVLAAIFLGERMTLPKCVAYLLGLGGLSMIFGGAAIVGPDAVLASAAMFGAAFLQAAGSVGVKRFNPQLPALTLVGGTLLLATPAYLVSWALLDGCPPPALPPAAIGSVLYLGIIATPFGFAFYFYVLKHLPATRVALITLITPVSALLLGHLANAEPISPRVVAGGGLILLALWMHEYGHFGRFRARRS